MCFPISHSAMRVAMQNTLVLSALALFTCFSLNSCGEMTVKSSKVLLSNPSVQENDATKIEKSCDGSLPRVAPPLSLVKSSLPVESKPFFSRAYAARFFKKSDQGNDPYKFPYTTEENGHLHEVLVIGLPNRAWQIRCKRTSVSHLIQVSQPTAIAKA